MYLDLPRELKERQAVLRRLIVLHAAEVEKQDPWQELLRRRQWEDIRLQAEAVMVIREMIAALGSS